ncbi:MAG: transcriptional repressor [bacterium]|nr:transcriptional repressor [bacterium]
MGLKESLKTKGIRLSRPRADVLEFFENNPSGHYSIGEIHERLKAQNKDVSFTSVYRACKLLEKLGYIRSITFEERHTHYESNLSPHLHFQCLLCGKIEEEPLNNSDSILELLPIEDKGFLVTSFRIQVLGICKDCQIKREVWRAHDENYIADEKG